MARSLPTFSAVTLAWQPASGRRGARSDVLLATPDLGEYHGPERRRAIDIVRAYCLRALGREPDATYVFKEQGPRPRTIYRVEARTPGRHPVILWVSDDGQIIQFPPRKRGLL